MNMKKNIPDIIIIRGAPGSGKSQTAKSLSKFFPKGVRLEVDTIRQMVISVDWKNQQEHINMLQVSTGLVNDFLKLGFKPIIIIDTFSGDKIVNFLSTIYQYNKNWSIIICGLFTTDDELKRRLELRSKEEFKDFAICKKLNDDIQKIKHGDEFIIDTTGLLPEQTADIIYTRLNEIVYDRKQQYQESR
ncbi:MAG: ATP-binding protein [Candidatus Thermoplasmatota archaeon]|nr:ATP-binding protein [Euryarchaeota archaeon]MBU4144029.1 ATP-binding protein [Candidatus Thermoplasmatota archaeon]MBU4591857.1 ATP-binding protein [Candidatus Thermoplasmatota archaeon]